MFKLTSILYEGFLKLPEKLIKQIQLDATNIYTKHLYLTFKDDVFRYYNKYKQYDNNVNQAIDKLVSDVQYGNDLYKKLINDTKEYYETSIGSYYNVAAYKEYEYELSIYFDKYYKNFFLSINQINPEDKDEVFQIYFEQVYNSKQGIDSQLRSTANMLVSKLKENYLTLEDDFLQKIRLLNDFKNKTNDINLEYKKEYLISRNDIPYLSKDEFKKVAGNYIPLLVIEFKIPTHAGERFISKSGDTYDGLYKGFDGYKFVIEIVFPFIKFKNFYIENFNKNIENINETITHEVGHLMQDILTYGKIGVDKRWYDLKQHLKNIKKKDFIPKGFGNPGRRLIQGDPEEHSLRDVEFYTNLGDAYSYISKRLIKVPPENRLEAFKAATGIISNLHIPVQDNFKILRDNNKLKWKKYVSEIYKKLKEEQIL